MLRPVFEYLQPENPKAAIALQAELRQRVIRQDTFADVQLVAGVDVGFEDQGATARAAAVVLQFPELTIIESAIARRPTTFPYIPGLLSFRELPVLLDVVGKLTTTPDLLLCDGHGYMHPRRLGIASHLGILLDHPTIGVAKSHFLGTHAPVGETAGAWQPITHQGEVIGAIVRNRTNVRPIYVSSGHRISLESAIQFVRQCTTKYRLPETTRLADRLSKQNGKL